MFAKSDRSLSRHALLIMLVVLAPGSYAQGLEEVLVVGNYREQQDLPGTYLKRRADALLLAITVSNDTRDEAARKSEIYRTLRNAVTAAGPGSIELTVLDKQNNVVALTADNYEIELRKGNRPDTSEATIRLRQKIPDTLTDPDQLIPNLIKFVRQVSVAGRTTLEPASGVDVSVVDPNQYRAQIVATFSQDVTQLMKVLGPDYRVLLDGIDRPVKFSRVGPIEVALYIPYSYRVVPTSISALGGD